MAGLLSLKWNNHSTSFLQSIGKIHLKEKYCDATIICQGKYFPVHRIVLSTCSLYFDEMFEMIKTPHPFIVFKDIDPREMELMLNYMYKGEINVEQDLLPTLIKAAEALKIKGIAVPDDFPSAKSSSDRKRNCTLENNVNPKRKAEEWKKTNVAKATLPNSFSISNTYSNIESSYSPEDSTKLNSSESRLEDARATAIKEEPVDVLDYDVNNMANNYSSSSNEITKETFDMYVNLPEKQESNFITNEDLVTMDKVESNQIPQINSFNNGNSVSNISSHDDNNVDHSPGPNFETEDLKSERNKVAGIECESAGEPSMGNGPSTSYDILGLAALNYYENESLQHNKESNVAKPFHCEICNRYFGLKQHLQNHMHIHTGIRNFVCTKCPKRFALKQHLQIHLRVHTGEKPYSCTQCTKKFRQKSHLNSHISCVHNVQGQNFFDSL